jgi:endo-1,4-beta-mannosidase
MEFILGVNYWPRKKAMFWWKDFDQKEVEDEFQIIKELNLDVVRIFLLWEDFQPKIDKIDEKSVKNLGKVLDIANDLDLKVIPTFFIGHMSGINWLPEWALDNKPHERFSTYSNGKILDLRAKDIYEDEEMLKAEKLLINSITAEFRDSPVIFAWDISNEIDNVRVPKTPEAGKRWVKLIYETIKENDNRPVTFGIHQEDIDRDKHFRVQDVAQFNDFLCMHAYSVYADWAENPLDPYVVPFACLLTKALGKKEVLMEEFGMPIVKGETKRVESYTGKEKAWHYLINEEEAAKWLEETLKLLYEFGVLGALYWNFSDYHESLWDKPPFDKEIHERFFGLLRSDGSFKPTALVIKNFKEKMKNLKRREVFIEVPENYYENPKENLVKLYRKFLKNMRG